MTMRKYLLSAVTCLLLITAPGLQAQESGIMTIEGTRIRGDQEMPTVMYLVPWQPPETEALRGRDERLMVSQAFEPVERYEFQRLVKYYGTFRQSHEEPVSQADTP